MSHHPERTARNVRPVNQPPSSINVTQNGHRVTVCQVDLSKDVELMRRRASFFPLPAPATTPTSATSARTATTGLLRRVRTFPTPRGACTLVRAISAGAATTAAATGSLFVLCEDLLNSARRMRRRAQLGGKPRRRRARRALKRPRAHSIHFDSFNSFCMASYEQRKDGVASGRARIPAAPTVWGRSAWSALPTGCGVCQII